MFLLSMEALEAFSHGGLLFHLLSSTIVYIYECQEFRFMSAYLSPLLNSIEKSGHLYAQTFDLS